MAQSVATQAQIAAVQVQLAKISNSSASQVHHSLEQVPNNAGQLPVPQGVWFPATLDELGATLTHHHANALLVFYTQPPIPNTDAGKGQKVAVMKRELGIRV